MNDFRILLKVKGKDHEFHFHKISMMQGIKYHVRVKAQSGFEEFFEIRQVSKGTWQIADPAPEWVREMGDKLIGIVVEKQRPI
jgi:hypothetical protein